LVEYALILALIAVVAILVLQGLGNKVNNTLSSVNANLP
jgi:Flp pilus assembly pilin Flp